VVVRPVLIALVFTLVVGPAAARAETLFDAVRAGDRQAVRTLIAKKADVNATQVDGSTALHAAVDAGDEEIARLLLDAGARATAATRYGVTPLALAARNGNASLIEALVKAGADANTASREGETALMTVTRSGSLAAAEKLLALGANPNAAESWHQQTALMWAASDNQVQIATSLMRFGADVNARSKVWPGQPPRPRGAETSFQSAHSNFPKGGFTALHFAAQYGAGEMAALLADNGADLQAAEPDGVTPLMMAIINGHYDVAAVLVLKGANVNAVDRSGRGALYHAVDMNTLEWLFSRPNPKPSGEMDAVGIARLLLARGADPNARLTARGFVIQHDSAGNANLTVGSTPFMKAATTSDVRMMRLLLEHGADPNIATQNRTTPMMAAAGLNWAEISSLGTEEDTIEAIKLMLGRGADVNAANDQGETPMHGAAQRGADRVVQFLADHGATLDAKNRRGRTPLDEAIGQANESDAANVRRPERPTTRALLSKLIAQRTVAAAGR
jgi:ankyrin repeat protein